MNLANRAKSEKKPLSIGLLGNVVDVLKECCQKILCKY